MILGADNRKAWSAMDILLMNAYQRYQDELCPTHGGPVWMCDNEDQSLRVRVREVRCEARAALDEYDEVHADDKTRGVFTRPEFYSANGRDLVEYRDLYREQKAREAAEDADSD